MRFSYKVGDWNIACERTSGTKAFYDFCKSNCANCIDKFEQFTGNNYGTNKITVLSGTVIILLKEDPIDFLL